MEYALSVWCGVRFSLRWVCAWIWVGVSDVVCFEVCAWVCLGVRWGVCLVCVGMCVVMCVAVCAWVR